MVPCLRPCPSMRWIRKRTHITPRPMGVADPRVALWLLACPVVFAANSQDGLTVSGIGRGVFVHLGKPLAMDVPGHDDIANIGFIVGAKCVAVIDTGGSMRIGRGLRAA